MDVKASKVGIGRWNVKLKYRYRYRSKLCVLFIQSRVFRQGGILWLYLIDDRGLTWMSVDPSVLYSTIGENLMRLTSMVSPSSLTAPSLKLPLVLAHDASETWSGKSRSRHPLLMFLWSLLQWCCRDDDAYIQSTLLYILYLQLVQVLVCLS